MTTSLSLAGRLFEGELVGDLVVEETWDFPGLEGLHVAERREVLAAVPRRQREFAAGRWCAHRALARLGIEEFAVRVGPHRQPMWPIGVVGSITHTANYCAAVAGRASDFRSVGIDAEPAEPLDADLIQDVCTSREQRRLSGEQSSARGLMARAHFCAKESWFKCQFPLTGVYVDFTELEVSLNLGHGCFIARYVGGNSLVTSQVPLVIVGSLLIDSDLILSAVVQAAR
jgi:4'-phosphopantetheinyl transferase EntD